MILVTGGAGYIGSLVAQKLAQRGKSVLVVDDLSGGGAPPAFAEFKKLDVRDQEGLRRIFTERDIEAVLHFAALIDVEESLRQRDLYMDVNFLGTKAICETMSEFGCKNLIFSSTAAVYSDPGGGSVGEGHPTDPTTPYGLSKLHAENLIQKFVAENKMSATAFRYFNVAGASRDLSIGQRYPKSLFKQLAKAAISGKAFTVHGSDYPTPDGSAVRDFIHVEDLAEVHILAADRNLSGFQCLNVGYGRGCSVLEAIQAMKKVSQVDFPVQVGPRRSGDLPSVVADASEISRQLSWKPQFDSILKIAESAYKFEKLSEIRS